MMADSGARGSREQVRQLAGMRGLMSKPSGEVIETPITANFREGLSVAAVLHLDPRRPQGPRRHRAQDGRLGLPDAPSRRRRAGRDRQRAGLRHDRRHLTSSAIMEGGEILEPLRDRIVGRVSQEDIYDPMTGEHADRRRRRRSPRSWRTRSRAAGIERVKIRSVLTCETRRGVCSRCYGRNLATGRHGRDRRGGGRHRRAVDRRARHAAHDAYLPLRRHGVARLRAVEARGEEPRHRSASSTSPRSRPRTATWSSSTATASC